jgi:8-oxo-dGTP pyrophosphatase MutT (NUDIX family)
MPSDATGVTTDLAAAARHVEQRLARDESLPGPAAQATMAPAPARADPSQMSVAGREGDREAGVLALLFPQAEEDRRPALLFTERQEHLDDHAGQVSFPGGQREAGESLEDTALREAQEEVALAPRATRMLGALTPLYIPPSGFCVHPFVGVAARPPVLHPADAEVAALLRVPLAELLAPGALAREPWTLSRGRPVEVPFFDVAGAPPIWGATAMVLAELLAVFRAASGQPSAARRGELNAERYPTSSRQ